MQGLISPSTPLLPASEITLIYFVSHLAKTVSYNTIKLYLFAVQDLHRQYNFPLKLPNMFRLQKVLNEIKRSQTPVKLDRYPITIQILQSIFNSYQPHLGCDLNYIMLWAAFTLAFFGFLRSREFTCNDKVFDPETHLCLKDVTLVPNTEFSNYMLVLIKRSKTDPFSHGCTLTLARSTTSICAVMAMKDYVLQCQSSSAGPLFTFTSGKLLTRTSLTHELRDVLQHCGILPQHYFSHSFRIGAATTAAAAGIPAWLIKVLGRWSSDCYEHYIRTPQETLLAIPKQLSMNCSTNCRLDRSLLST